MMKQDVTKVDVTLNALCYAFWQAEDYIAVVFREADEDEQVHFMQAQRLAAVVCEYYAACDDAARANCHWYNSHIADVAQCKTLEEYKQLNKA